MLQNAGLCYISYAELAHSRYCHAASYMLGYATEAMLHKAGISYVRYAELAYIDKGSAT